MAKSALVADLLKLVEQLKSERRQHEEAIAEIDRTFASLGLGGQAVAAVVVRRRPGRPPKNPALAAVAAAPATGGRRRRRGRGSFDENADSFVKRILSEGKPLSTNEVNDKWRAAGRGGKADNTLSRLAREGQIVRRKAEGVRGSVYSLA